MSYRAFKVKLDPTPRQQRALFSACGGARFAFNYCLHHIKEELDAGRKPNTSFYSLNNWFNSVKYEIAPWCVANPKEVYSYSIMDLATAFKNFYESKQGKRKGEEVGFPKYKNRRSKKKLRVSSSQFSINDNHGIKLAKVGRIHTLEPVTRLLGVKVVNCTISFDGDCWYASVMFESDSRISEHPKQGTIVGIDLGIKDLAILSDGIVYDNPRPMTKLEKKRAKYNKRMARQQGARKGEKQSNHYKQNNKKLRKIERKIANQRRDHREKMSTEICKTHEVICIEDLNAKNMQKNHKLAKSVSDASFGSIREALKRKASDHGCTIIEVDTFYPSSKTCSQCGSVKAKLDLNERTYCCEECGLEIDRDLNAALNLERIAKEYLAARSAQEAQNARGGVVRLSLPVIHDLEREHFSIKRESGCESVRPEAIIGNDDMCDAV